ncbi:MAG TPA: 5-methyltetrahydropteroyltriglutamate--homocysteine S-methyltransferase, partial [Burkholderiales bacterium]|nr:5-methyltetrahydropteroyltriglutamate--homocysteine S-methyltransferase [Burkholderiales bacterium]
DLLDGLVAVYAEILERLRKQGVEWVQIDEPVLTLDLPQRWIEALDSTYARLHSSRIPKLLLCTYFESVAEHSERLKRLPVAGLHLDLIRSPQQLDAFLDRYPEDKVLSLGVVDGRNIWRCNLAETLQLLESVQQGLGKRLWVAPSCSLLHSPINVDAETKLAPDLRSWLAFGTQKLGEVATLVRGLNEGSPAIQAALDLSNASHTQRQRSPRIHDPAVAQRLAASTTADATRQSPYAARQEKQRLRFDLPAFPTTTIGSFPQTSSIRSARAAHKRGAIGEEAYATAMKEEIALVVRQQETIGLDVLVHGEAERNDMVEYFGEQLRGFAFSEHGWVQSYGSRCVKPPIIYGDVSRPRAMTVEWFRYAQSLTTKPMKGMLTGPVTMLQWSFERDDQPRAQTARQIALAIRDEVLDLEAAGAGMIQIDEPAFREGLPLKASARAEYLDWAVEAFRLAGAGVRDDTQIHTHMCYAEFNDILSAIAALDADVITIETSRSDMELLKGFGSFRYPNEMGPGVYDIHSPRVPDTEDMLTLLRKACAVIDPRRLWVNPDCGLKTRGWPEVELALNRMVAAAQLLRTQY